MKKFVLVTDKNGMIWDLLLYVPTVSFLATLAMKFWYEGNQNFSYLLTFMASFFFLAGFNRITKTRLMLLGSAPVAVEVDSSSLKVLLKNGSSMDVIKEIKRYGDYAGKSFGLSGLDGTGKRQQFVFHKGQFQSPDAFQEIQKEIDKLRG